MAYQNRSMREITHSDGAKRFKEKYPRQYDEALHYAYTLEYELGTHSIKGDYRRVIIPSSNSEFLLEWCDTLGDAITMCKNMGWPVVYAS